MSVLLIDADNVAIAIAAKNEANDVEYAYRDVDTAITNQLQTTGCSHYELWLSGKLNFRYRIYNEYKSNRIEKARPIHEKAVKQYMVDAWQANYSEDCEADDMLGVRQMELTDSTISHLDKDINMIPGRHYNWALTRNGVVVREERVYDVTDEEALRFFYTQLITGDATDNIKGVPGFGPKKAANLLDPLCSEKEFLTEIRCLYSSDEEMELNARCLWIWRKLGDIYSLSERLERCQEA